MAKHGAKNLLDLLLLGIIASGTIAFFDWHSEEKRKKAVTKQHLFTTIEGITEDDLLKRSSLLDSYGSLVNLALAAGAVIVPYSLIRYLQEKSRIKQQRMSLSKESAELDSLIDNIWSLKQKEYEMKKQGSDPISGTLTSIVSYPIQIAWTVLEELMSLSLGKALLTTSMLIAGLSAYLSYKNRNQPTQRKTREVVDQMVARRELTPTAVTGIRISFNKIPETYKFRQKKEKEDDKPTMEELFNQVK